MLSLCYYVAILTCHTNKEINVFVQNLISAPQTFVEEGIAVSRFTGEYIQNGLQSALTSNISEALSTLTSEEVTFKPLQYVPSQFIPKSDRMVSTTFLMQPISLSLLNTSVIVQPPVLSYFERGYYLDVCQTDHSSTNTFKVYVRLLFPARPRLVDQNFSWLCRKCT